MWMRTGTRRAKRTRHIAGTQGEFGCGVTSSPSTSQSGVRLAQSMRS